VGDETMSVAEWQSSRFWGFRSLWTMPSDRKTFIADAKHHNRCIFRVTFLSKSSIWHISVGNKYL